MATETPSTVVLSNPYNLSDKPDLVIRTRNGDFKVHQKILAAFSSRFASDIAVSAKLTAFVSTITTQEQVVASPIALHVVPENAEIMSRIVRYIYDKRGFKIVAPGVVAAKTSLEIKDMLTLCMSVCIAAEKYNLFPLREIATGCVLSPLDKLAAPDLIAFGDRVFKSGDPALKIMREAITMRTAQVLRAKPGNSPLWTQLTANAQYNVDVLRFMQWSEVNLGFEITKLEAAYSD